ncbi:MAG: NAD(P)-dependent oxidoreductase [Firmicutes bacterium]|nr:NAD(P)-dependent oxidoreductase [Bacillota bacterium]
MTQEPQSNAQRIGFIGLGTMGMPMAGHLLDKGFDVTVYNRTAERATALCARGAKLAPSIEALARECDVVFTMLTADAAVKDVLLGPHGVAMGARSGTLVIDCSTIAPTTSQVVATELAERGIAMLDAPVSGSKPQAESAQLTFMVGGDRADFDASQPLFAALGKASFYMGPHGAGEHAKLAINTMLAINLLSLTEGLALAKAGGLDLALFTQVIAAGGARSGVAENKAARIAAGEWDPQFMVELLHKDLLLATQLAAGINLPLPILASVRSLLQMAMAQGYGREDMAAVFKCYDAWLSPTR